ncbi:NUDIX hydrolase [Paraflavisolibacter sp. H34]|uniref:NUDIX hydrolase n=1 Tax=Huijunlia imazamoxiresistens TaxID=3127457 RepID=UPI003016EE4B
MKWKVLSSEYLFQVPWLTVRKDRCELPNGKVMPAFYVLEYPTWVTALALTKDNKVVMVKQYRHGIEEIGIETPGGVVDAGEEPLTAIKRELLEETGHEFESFEYLGKICANPSTGNNFMHMYLATGGEKVTGQSLDEHEDLEVLLYDLDEVKQLLKENRIMQALHTATLFYGLNKLGEMKY